MAQDPTSPSLDAVDHALIRELQQDARVSNVALAAKVKLTEGAVRRRIDRLIKSGTLRIVGVGDPARLGLMTHVVIGMRVEMAQIEALLDRFARMSEFSYVYQTTGRFDIVAVAFFKSNNQLREFLTKRLGKVAGVVEVETFLIMKAAKRSFRWGEGAEGGGT
ncbi:MAG: Lrp/AsnC family transcriptional regulator [Alphaproteobacteria bacterium]|nr:Lrp/AsnC family transcriptional regulator [Alphaproteobacteria bacterium]